MLAVLMSLLGCDAPSQSCTEMYAPDMLTVEVTAEAGWAGEVELSASGDGVTITCVLPDGESAASCDDLQSNLSLSGDTLTASLWELAPDSVELVVRVDGVEVAAQTLAPSYTEDEPNGSGCGVRLLATETISL